MTLSAVTFLATSFPSNAHHQKDIPQYLPYILGHATESVLPEWVRVGQYTGGAKQNQFP